MYHFASRVRMLAEGHGCSLEEPISASDWWPLPDSDDGAIIARTGAFFVARLNRRG